ncbi:MAG: NAD(P)H-flavin reductase [Wenzhouxiangellaceae bacterium]
MIDCMPTDVGIIARDTARVMLQPVAGGLPELAPGQYLEVVLRPGSRMPLSIANVPSLHDSQIELHIRHGESKWRANDLLARAYARKPIAVEMPKGWVWQKPPLESPLTLVAGGTGFAQSKAILEALFAADTTLPIRLFWKVRQMDDFYMLDVLDRWTQQHPSFAYHLLASEDDNETDFWAQIEAICTDIQCSDLLVSGSRDFVLSCQAYLMRNNSSTSWNIQSDMLPKAGDGPVLGKVVQS